MGEEKPAKARKRAKSGRAEEPRVVAEAKGGAKRKRKDKKLKGTALSKAVQSLGVPSKKKKKKKSERDAQEAPVPGQPDASVQTADASKPGAEALPDTAVKKQKTKQETLISGPFERETKHVAIDCEMVGVGSDGTRNALARCSIVNRNGHVLFDTYVRPKEHITDYRTHVSGIEYKHIKNAPTLDQIQEKVSTLLSGRVLVGHSVQHDLQVLLLDHPRKSTRDTSGYKPFRKLAKGRAPALRKLAKEILGIQVQDGSHSSVEDAQVTMALYRSVQRDWEAQLRLRAKKGGRNGPSSHSATQQETPNTAG